MEKVQDRARVLEGAIRVFDRRGLKFTMADLAAEMGMSKKTLYVLFAGKEDLLLCMVDHCFASIKEAEEKVLRDPSLDTAERLRRVLGVLPEVYDSIDMTKLSELADRYPRVYERVRQRLESDWEGTISLLEKGMAEGTVRPVSIPIFKLMFESSLERFFREEALREAGLSYRQGLSEVVSILVEGILVRDPQARGQQYPVPD